jgi:hypothetical protein
MGLRAAVALTALLLGGCFLWPWGGEEGEGEAASPEQTRVDDAAAALLARRASEFYARLEGVSLVTALTYEDPRLQSYFASRRAYDDYFASLATQIRAADLRYRQAERVEVRELRLLKPEEAVVELMLYGHHTRRLRFWEIELPRTDTWVRVDGRWVIRPEKL